MSSGWAEEHSASVCVCLFMHKIVFTSSVFYKPAFFCHYAQTRMQTLHTPADKKRGKAQLLFFSAANPHGGFDCVASFETMHISWPICKVLSVSYPAQCSHECLIPSSFGLDFRSARQRVWLAAWQQCVCWRRDQQNWMSCVRVGGYKESGNCASLQLRAYVSIGRNALASPPSLTHSFTLLSPTLPPLLCSFATSNRLLTPSLPSFPKSLLQCSVFFSIITPSLLSHIMFQSDRDLDSKRCVVFSQPKISETTERERKEDKDRLSHTDTPTIWPGMT